YLSNLREQMKKAADEAALTTQDNQNRYCATYNRRARMKTFSVGDKCLVFNSGGSSKLDPKWIGPCEVIDVERPHTYTIEFPDGRQKSVHANHMKTYISRISAIGVIFDDEAESFGEVEPVPSASSLISSSGLTAEDLQHLSSDQ